MPVVLRYNDQLELNLSEYHRSVSFAELEALAEFLADNPGYLKRDALSHVLPGATFDGVELAALDRLFDRYAGIFAPMEFQIVRRSAWLCQSPVAQPFVDYWIGERDTREAMSSTLRQFDTFAEAGDWLVLSEAEALALRTGVGFQELARFEEPQLRAEAPAAAARR